MCYIDNILIFKKTTFAMTNVAGLVVASSCAPKGCELDL